MSEINEARAYGVYILPTTVEVGAPYWKAVTVRHLSPLENRSRHHVFVDVVDESGARIRDSRLRVGWSWEGRRDDERADPVPLDKPDNEPAGNVPLGSGQYRIWVIGNGLSSEAVDHLSTNHPDEPTPGSDEKFNTNGHHSFYVKFQRAVAGGVVVVPPTSNGDLVALVKELQGEVAALKQWQRMVAQFMRAMIGDL